MPSKKNTQDQNPAGDGEQGRFSPGPTPPASLPQFPDVASHLAQSAAPGGPAGPPAGSPSFPPATVDPPLEDSAPGPPEAIANSVDVSSEVREIMGRTPHWILRSGLSIMGVTVLLLLSLSWLVHYPDTIKARITVTGLNPAVGVVARQDGALERLEVEEKQAVAKGELLALIKSPANPDRVFGLKEEIQKLRPFLSDENSFADLDLAAESELGTLQSSYSDFHSAYLLYRNTLADEYTEKTIASLDSQLKQKLSQVAAIQQQTAASSREVELARLKYERMKKLNERLTISMAELQEQEAELLAQQRAASEVRKSLLGEEIALTGFEKDIRDLRHQRAEKLRETRTTLRESLKKLLSDIEIWETNFVLRAPTDGFVAFYEFWSDQQHVQKGKEVFIIVPKESPLVGRVQVAKGGSGKIRKGQAVRVRFDDFPYKEFGVVTGVVESVSLVPRNGTYLVSVKLEYPLVTSYGKSITFKQDMAGDASIVTDDRRLIGRIFNEFRKAFINSTAVTPPPPA